MNRYKNARELELSLLAQGRGLIDGGVELDCFGDDRKAFTLNGESFIKPSTSPEGQHAKQYKRYQLALPKTYVTRKGQMVLFTSPEDMIIGHSVTLQHRKEVTIASAARKLRTVNKLVSSTMDYEPAKPQSTEVGEFTPVYLQRLREAAERAKEAENYEAQGMDKDENMEPDDLEAADSGVGASLRPSSSGRLSSLSHYSDAAATIHIIPGERLTEEKEEDTQSPTDPLKLLAGELAGHMTSSSHKGKAKSGGAKGTKKRKTTADVAATQSQKQKSSKTAKGKKRKRSKKPPQKDGVTASSESSKVKKSDRMSELESKRREKRELERQRDLEARERERLQANLRELQDGSRTEFDLEPGALESSDGVRGEYVAMAKGRKTVAVHHSKSGDICHREGRADTTRRPRLTEAERAQKAKEAYEKGAKLREKSNYENQLELLSLRHSQSITPAYTFSYFQYVPTGGTQKSDGNAASKEAHRGQQTKRQKRPPKK